MHILFCGMSSNRGGKETYIIGMYRELLKYGNQIDFLATDDHIVFEKEIKKNGSKIYHIPGRSKGLSQYKKNLHDLFEKVKFDVLWSHKTTLSSIEEFDAAKSAGVKVRIIHSHCTKNMGNQFTAIMHAINMHRISHLANVFFACSEDAGKYFFGTKSFQVIRNGFEVNKYQYNKEEEAKVRKTLALNNKFVVMHVGRFSPEKNHKFILSVFNQIHNQYTNSVLILCGDGNLLNEIKKETSNQKLDGSVIFLGIRDDIDKIIQCANVFLLPSLHEGIPYSLLEAQAAGVPCVISDNLSDCVIESNQVKKIPLKSSPSLWAKTCLKYKNYDKSKTEIFLDRDGYNISLQSSKIEKDLSKLI